MDGQRPDEIRPSRVNVDDAGMRRQEITMARSLIETMAMDFDATAFTDRYRGALQALVDAKIAGREVVAPAEDGDVIDLSEALKASTEWLQASTVKAAKKAPAKRARKSA